MRPNGNDLFVDPVGSFLSVLVGLRTTLSDSARKRTAVERHLSVGIRCSSLHSIKAATSVADGIQAQQSAIDRSVRVFSMRPVVKQCIGPISASMRVLAPLVGDIEVCPVSKELL